MAVAKKNKRNTRNTATKKSLPWGPMIISFLVGAFIMFLLHIKDNSPPEQVAKEDKKVEQKVTKKSKSTEPTFEFYTLLPEMEVVVKEPKQAKPAIVTIPTQAITKNTTETIDKVSYILQVGSFRKAGDADAYKAKLAFIGVESKVQKVTIDNKDTWHRVQVGPVIGRNKADSLQKQLKKNSIDSLMMRAKNG